MDTPSDAAKAASIAHHTWGVEDYATAVTIYNTLASSNIGVDEFLEQLGCGRWEMVERISQERWWEEVEALALSIDAATVWQAARDNTRTTEGATT